MTNWQNEINLKEYIEEDPPNFNKMIEAIKPFNLHSTERHLKRAKRLWKIDVETAEAFCNIALRNIYDYCDEHKIWVK